MSQRATALFLDLGMWIETHGWRPADTSQGAIAAAAIGAGVSPSDIATEPTKADTDDTASVFDQPVADFAIAILDRQYRKLRKRGRGFNKLPMQARHDLRIDVKKLRYTAEFFAALGDAEDARAFLSKASHLQDVLGEMNDVATLTERLDGLSSGEPGKAETIKTELARGIGLVIDDARAQMSHIGEAEMRKSWRTFKRCRPFWQV